MASPTSSISRDMGIYKSGNGAEYLQYLEQKSNKRNLREMSAYMDTRDNIYYTKIRDEMSEKHRRIYNLR